VSDHYAIFLFVVFFGAVFQALFKLMPSIPTIGLSGAGDGRV
jgi:hypothetical protein